MTDEITIIYKNREVLLELLSWHGSPQTWFNPEEPPGFEITEARYENGRELAPDEIEHLTSNEHDQIMEKLVEFEERTREDAMIEEQDWRERLPC